MQDDFSSNNNRAIQIGKDLAKQEIEQLKAENARYREALERIENECSRHDTSAWSIASDALEGE